MSPSEVSPSSESSASTFIWRLGEERLSELLVEVELFSKSDTISFLLTIFPLFLGVPVPLQGNGESFIYSNQISTFF